MEAAITSLANPVVKEAAGLLQKKYRDKRRAFLLEGWKNVSEAITAGLCPQRVFFDPSALPSSAVAFLKETDMAAGTDLLAVSGGIIRKLSDTKTPQPIVAVFDKFSFALRDIPLHGESFVIVADGLKDPGNLGAIIRTADAAGIDAVILAENCVDLFAPKTLRAAMGSAFHLPVLAGFANTDILAWLRAQAFAIFAAVPRAAQTVYQADFSGRAAVVLGSETQGVNDFFAQAAAHTVSIPMKGRAESLNAAVAAALFIYKARGGG
ncbi:MAG: RNA methyltransferase [Acidaminococcales bacterium]|jgi:TrmH family RNA methyltransferase|nr:RNA methyltransferase [Acidaminococcales bacterium]